MKKKGQDMGLSVTGWLILALVFTAGGLAILYNLSEAVVERFDKEGCKASVIGNSKFRLPGLQDELINIDCPPRYVTMDVGKFTIEYNENEIEEKVKECGDLSTRSEKECYLERVNERISYLLFDCWDKFAAGNLPLFSRYDSARQCVLCSRVEFTPAVQAAFDIGSANVGDVFLEGDPTGRFPLNDYMQKHNPELHTISFFDFTLDKIDAFAGEYYDYTLDNPYAAIFVANNEKQDKHNIEVAWESIASFFTDRENDVSYQYVNTLEWVPYDEVVTECDVLV